MTLEAYINALAEAEDQLKQKSTQLSAFLPTLTLTGSTAGTVPLDRADPFQTSLEARKSLSFGIAKLRGTGQSKGNRSTQKSKAAKTGTDHPTKARPNKQSSTKDAAVKNGLSTAKAEQAVAALSPVPSMDQILAEGLVEQFFIKQLEERSSCAAAKVAQISAKQGAPVSFRRQTYTVYAGNEYDVLRQRLIATRSWRQRMLDNNAPRRRFALRVSEKPSPEKFSDYKITKSMRRWFGVIRNDAVIAAHLKTYEEHNCTVTYVPEQAKKDTKNSQRYAHLRKAYGQCV